MQKSRFTESQIIGTQVVLVRQTDDGSRSAANLML